MGLVGKYIRMEVECTAKSQVFHNGIIWTMQEEEYELVKIRHALVTILDLNYSLYQYSYQWLGYIPVR